MPSDEPLLTVAIPTYNSAHFLHDSVGSIMRQGLDDYEIVIVDNASEDNTEEVVRSLGDAPIRYFRNKRNLGSRENHNRCLSESRGVYVKLLSADDVLLDGVLNQQLEVLMRNPQVSLVTSDMLVTNSTLGDRKLSRFFPGASEGNRVIRLCLSSMQNFVGGPSNIMFRRKDSDGLNFDSNYRFVSDLKFELELLRRGNYFNIDKPGFLYRRHSQADTEVNCPPQIHCQEYLTLINEFNHWNLLNCILTIRRGSTVERKKARKEWIHVLTAEKLLHATCAASDLFRTRYFRETLNKPVALSSK